MNTKIVDIAVIVLSMSFGIAQAQAPEGGTTLKLTESTAKPTGPAPRELVRECMDTQDALTARQAKMEANTREHEKSLAVAQAETIKLNEMQELIDKTDQGAIDAYNKKRAVQNEKAAAINARADAFQAEVDAYNAASLAYNKKCAAIIIRVHDRNAVMKERANKAKAEAATKSK